MLTKERVIADQWLVEFAELGGQHQVWRDAAGQPEKIGFMHPPKATSRQRRQLLALHQKFQRASADVRRLIISDLAAAASDPERRGPTGLLLPRTARVAELDPDGKKLSHVGAELARYSLALRNQNGEAPRAAVDLIAAETRKFIEGMLGPDASDEEIADAQRIVADGFAQMACVLLAAESERGDSRPN